MQHYLFIAGRSGLYDKAFIAEDNRSARAKAAEIKRLRIENSEKEESYSEVRVYNVTQNAQVDLTPPFQVVK